MILLSAQGRRFDQGVASELAALERMVLICGRYEGVDERVGQYLADRELSDRRLRAERRRTGRGGDCRLRYATDSRRGWQSGVDAAGIVHERCSRRRETARIRRAPRVDCWIIRTTRVLRIFAGWWFRKCWLPAIMKRYDAGAGVLRWRKHCATGPIFGRGGAQRRRQKIAG